MELVVVANFPQLAHWQKSIPLFLRKTDVQTDSPKGFSLAGSINLSAHVQPFRVVPIWDHCVPRRTIYFHSKNQKKLDSLKSYVNLSSFMKLWSLITLNRFYQEFKNSFDLEQCDLWNKAILHPVWNDKHPISRFDRHKRQYS